MDLALDQPVALQAAQRLRQHFLRNPTNGAMQGAVSHCPLRKNLNDQRRPFVRNAIEHKPRRTLRLQDRWRRFPHLALAALLDQAHRKRIPIQFAVACLNRRDNDKDRVQHPEQNENRNADEDKTENHRDCVVN